MKKIKTKYIILILIVLIPILLIILSQKEETADKVFVEKELHKIIEKLSSKDLNFENFSEEYSYMNLDENFGEEQIPFHDKNIFNFIPPELLDIKEHEACIKFSEENYQKIFEEYHQELAYEIKVDDESKLINLKIKTFNLRAYHLVLTLLTDLLIEDLRQLDDFELFFANRCIALKEMQNHIDEYKNQDYHSIKLKYKIKNEKLIVEDIFDLGRALVGGLYNDDTSQEAADETGQKAYNIAKKYYEALK